MGLHISAGNGTRLNAKGNILIVNVDRAFITNFAAATGRARTLESTMPSLDDVIRSLLEREGPAAALPWSGPEAEDFARRVQGRDGVDAER